MTFGEVKYGDRFADLDKRIWVKTSLVSVGLFGNFNAMRPCCSGREPNWHKFNDLPFLSKMKRYKMFF